ncbi:MULTISPECIES: NAD(P)/FAD-dependent oxidoreductase [unclassified Arenibacter]|jgi:thioredoxin reductase|uniref:NAD(P)/FAD-dependent oxidoreductase n=1 Tax=unclassified Arenibacter TaxID=2615047 RepID=UPI000E349422|nr:MULTISPECIES: NAD(P)/FAD-dependent oxidoreductase [unclassified Arenibacter]MCM4163661.1 pyridine nucleotide-disulfide oxidoreductase [Arenibacter sp. A80]RFT56388.1 NAD(P)/FAD-dependent oxidoreductase [Arenibacter sp. P308M17]
MRTKNFEVIIIGGSYAGLSAAMALGRSLRKVLIIDSGLPCNRQTPQSHNFITQDGVPPHQITAIAKEQLLQYKTVDFVNDLALSAEKNKNGFSITTQSGNVVTAQKLIIATGIKDLIPKIKGFEACWGISMIHCPYCHGYEFRNKKTAIMANGERAFHLASLVNNLTDDISILTTAKADFTSEQLVKLKSHRIAVIETEVAGIEHQDGHLQKVLFSNGKKLAFDAIYAGLPFSQNSDIPVSLGCELTEQGYIKVNEFQQTTIAGIYACGDNSTRMRSVAAAVASGNLAGAMVNAELTKEHF